MESSGSWGGRFVGVQNPSATWCSSGKHTQYNLDSHFCVGQLSHLDFLGCRSGDVSSYVQRAHLFGELSRAGGWIIGGDTWSTSPSFRGCGVDLGLVPYRLPSGNPPPNPPA